jgi:hypothetical protein
MIVSVVADMSAYVVALRHWRVVVFVNVIPRDPTLTMLRTCAAASVPHSGA